MATVTMELRTVLSLDQFNLFDFEYQITDLTWKAKLEELIKNYFFFHEIGQETVDRFKHVFKNRMQLIMPRYDKLYQATLLNNKPLINYYQKENTTQTSGTKTSTTSTDYPQHDDPVLDIPTMKADGSTDGNATFERIVEGTTGKSYSQLILEYASAIYDIELMIIRDLKPCFILVY